jgi:pimeloyl-ACP methyl ester carboxylesterase
MEILTSVDGRSLAYDTYGDPDGLPVIFSHGFADSRLIRNPHDDLTKSLGVWMIAADQPGVGGSAPKKGRRTPHVMRCDSAAQICSGTEDVRCPSQDSDPQVGIIVQSVECIADSDRHLGVDGVSLLGSLHAHHKHMLSDFNVDGHSLNLAYYGWFSIVWGYTG